MALYERGKPDNFISNITLDANKEYTFIFDWQTGRKIDLIADPFKVSVPFFPQYNFEILRIEPKFPKIFALNPTVEVDVILRTNPVLLTVGAGVVIVAIAGVLIAAGIFLTSDNVVKIVEKSPLAFTGFAIAAAGLVALPLISKLKG